MLASVKNLKLTAAEQKKLVGLAERAISLALAEDCAEEHSDEVRTAHARKVYERAEERSRKARWKVEDFVTCELTDRRR